LSLRKNKNILWLLCAQFGKEKMAINKGKKIRKNKNFPDIKTLLINESPWGKQTVSQYLELK
jgi:hypothetical protein